MKLKLSTNRTIHENAAAYYEEAKKWKNKTEGVKKAILETKKKIEKAKKIVPEEKKIRIKEAVKKEWFEKFHYFTTSGGFLVIAGKEAKQNDILGARHMDENDYFFHADITGAAATILKTGDKTPSEQDEHEAAQWAACYSKAWKSKYQSIDVYRALGKQTSKQSHGEYVGKGGFMVYGERQWFRNTELKIGIIKQGNKIIAIPAVQNATNQITLAPGDTLKNKASKDLAKKLQANEEELMQIIPGDCTIL